VDGSFALDVLPGMLLLGFAGGITFNPILMAAMGDVAPTEAGLASGIVNTSFMMGGALGLAVLASLAASRTDSAVASGDATAAALNSGFHAAFLGGAAFAVVGAVLAAALLHPTAAPAHGEDALSAGPPGGEPLPEEQGAAAR
jgi:MFS family permease